MKSALLLALLATPWLAGSASAQSNYLSNYGGGGGGGYLSAYGGGSGGGDYRSALGAYGGGYGSGGGGSFGDGYINTATAKRSHFQRGGDAFGFTGRFVGGYNAQWHGMAWNNGLRNLGFGSANRAAPCGNFQRAAARCRNTTMAWDPTFQTRRGW